MKRFLALLLFVNATAAYGEIYTWQGAGGTEFYTNSLEEIPARYLKKARVLDVATGKKGGLATAQPVPAAAGQAQPAPTASEAAPAAQVAQPQLQETREQRRARRRRGGPGAQDD